MPLSTLPEPITSPISTTPRATRCACGAPVIRALDARACAFTAVVDRAPVTAAGEVAALREGRWTWQADGGGLTRRTRTNIPGHPPGQPWPVHAEHRCHQPLPAAWLAPVPDPVPTPKELSW